MLEEGRSDLRTTFYEINNGYLDQRDDHNVILDAQTERERE